MRESSSPTAETSTDAGRSWWTRPCGGFDVLRVAWPLVISTGSFSMMHYFDRLFLEWHSQTQMAAAMPSGLLHFLLVCFPLGVATYVNTFVAQYVGADQPKGVGRSLGQALRIGAIATPFYLLLIPLAPWIFHMVGHTSALREYETVYFQTLTWSAGALILASTLSAYYTGRGRTWPVMVIDVTSVVIDIFLNWVLVLGHLGVSAMGIEGAGWATVVALWCRVAMYVIAMRWSVDGWRRFGVWEGLTCFDWTLFKRILRFGGPSGMQLFIEIAGFTTLVLLVGRLGELETAATTLTFTINTIAFLPLLGVSIAVSTLVGQGIGSGRPDLASRATWTAFWMAAVYMIFMAVLYWGVPGWFLALHEMHADAGEFAALRSATIVLLRFVAIYSFLDAANLVFVAALKGAGDTRFIMIVSTLVSLLAVVVSFILVDALGRDESAFRAIVPTLHAIGDRFDVERKLLGLYACWAVLTVWISTLGVIYWARFLQGRWRTMTVIETGPHGDDAQAVLAPESAVVSPKST